MSYKHGGRSPRVIAQKARYFRRHWATKHGLKQTELPSEIRWRLMAWSRAEAHATLLEDGITARNVYANSEKVVAARRAANESFEKLEAWLARQGDDDNTEPAELLRALRAVQ